MNFIPILISFSLGEDSHSDSDLEKNSTIHKEQIVMDPKEYYLIILGILVGTLIFLFIAFSILFLRNKNHRRNSNRNSNSNRNNNIYSYEQRYINNPLAYPYTFDSYNFEGVEFTKDYNDELANTNHNLFNMEKKEDINNTDNESSSSFEGFGEQDEYIEVKNKSLKRRVSTSDIKIKKNEHKIRRNSVSFDTPNNDTIGKNKNNLMEELRKSLPNLIPKNMIND